MYMLLFRMFRYLAMQVSEWRKKPRIVYMNTDDIHTEPTPNTDISPQTPQPLGTAQFVPISPQTPQPLGTAQFVPVVESSPTPQSVPTLPSGQSLQPSSSDNPIHSSSDMDTDNTPVSMNTCMAIHEMEDVVGDEAQAVTAGSAEAQAEATGVDPQQPSGRKGRGRKNNATTPRAAIAKKTKVPKPPRNPFRRSETGKLQLKSLQMGKRVETMTPRVSLLRDRLETMESRLQFIAGKLKLVKEELVSREDEATTQEPNTATNEDGEAGWVAQTDTEINDITQDDLSTAFAE